MAGGCQRCRNSAYLLDGRCVPHASTCAAAGLVAVGDNPYGRACIEDGGVCRFDSQRSCRSPRTLGDCVASRIGIHNATCLECHDASWLINGMCKQQLYCGLGNVYAETGATCNCNKRTEGGEIVRTCKRCYVRKVPRKGGVFFTNPQGALTECKSCKAPHLMHNGKCVPRAECPSSRAQYLVGTMNGRCEAPFACVKGERLGGDLQGGNCKCSNGSLCRDCMWNAGQAQQQCTMCKKHTLVFNGECISAAKCINMGLMPVKGTVGARGGRCLKSTLVGTDER